MARKKPRTNPDERAERVRSPRRVAPPPEPEPVEAVGAVVPSTEGPPAPPAPPTKGWLEWYNGAALDDQQAFDRAASVIDNGGVPYQKGGSQEQYVENWRSRGPEFYSALVNYRDTGGRRALFAQPEKDYGARPISMVAKGGPIEQVAQAMWMLHPGRYTYTDVTDNGPAFENWLRITQAKSVSVGQTQVSPSTNPFGKPYYTDVEFMVSADTPWPAEVNGQKLNGFPTWLPKKINIVDYWGQVTKYQPDWLAPFRGLDTAADLAKSIGTLAAIIGIAYVVHTLAPSDRH